MLMEARTAYWPAMQSQRLRSARFAGLMARMEGKGNKTADLSDQTRWMLAVRDAGDREAFAMLFDFYAPRVKAMAMRSGSPPAVAEDIVQDVMLRVWRSRAQFDPTRAQVSSWIYQIARNRRIDLARREIQALPEDLWGPPAADEPGDALAFEQEVARLRTALRALPAGQREMVEKAYLGELTHQDISRQAELPLGTVKSRLRLAIDRLRHELRGLRK
jgi:RNA polymerase sigma-70 factor (ECF subfamily)